MYGQNARSAIRSEADRIQDSRGAVRNSVLNHFRPKPAWSGIFWLNLFLKIFWLIGLKFKTLVRNVTENYRLESAGFDQSRQAMFESSRARKHHSNAIHRMLRRDGTSRKVPYCFCIINIRHKLKPQSNDEIFKRSWIKINYSASVPVNAHKINGEDFFREEGQIDGVNYVLFLKESDISIIRKSKAIFIDGTFKIGLFPQLDQFQFYIFIIFITVFMKHL